MLSFLKTKSKRLMEQAELLIDNVLNRLPEEYNSLKAQQALYDLSGVYLVPNPDSGTVIMLQLGLKPNANEGDVDHKGQCYELSGITIPHSKTGRIVEIRVPIWHGYISNICFPDADVDLLNYDVTQVSTKGFKSKELVYVNEDLQKVMALLKGCEENLFKLDLEYTFEIETAGSRSFTIVDMEDGSYITVDQKRRVLRIDHNADEPEKMLNSDVTEFLREYSGYKEDLRLYFE